MKNAISVKEEIAFNKAKNLVAIFYEIDVLKTTLFDYDEIGKEIVNLEKLKRMNDLEAEAKKNYPENNWEITAIGNFVKRIEKIFA